MENFNVVEIPSFEDEKAQALVDSLKEVFEKSQNNFAKICEGVYKMRACSNQRNNFFWLKERVLWL